jgi:serine/threonine-protein kinase
VPAWRRWLGFVVAVAAMGVAGYLVAALYLFPAPLLPNEREVPRLLGLDEEAAAAEARRAGLDAAAAGREPHPSAAAGRVIWQDPVAGVAVPRGSRIALVTSDGPPRAAVPDVHGFDELFARRLLAAAGFVVETVDSVLVKDVPPGTVAGTLPPAGALQTVGRSVTLQLAR